MTPEIQLQIFELVAIIIGMVGIWMNTRNRRTDAGTATITADAKQATAVTDLAMLNYQERKDLSDSVIVLRENLSYMKGQHDEALRVATAKIEALEKQMKELGVTYEGRILVLENEITALNKTITARDATITGLEKQVKMLSETVEKFLAAQTSTPRTGAVTSTPGAGIPIELTVKGGITATSPLEKPPHEDIA